MKRFFIQKPLLLGMLTGFLMLLIFLGIFLSSNSGETPLKEASTYQYYRMRMLNDPNRITAVLYHHVTPEAASEYNVDPSTFEAQIKAYRSMGYKTITTFELAKAFEGKGTLPKHSLLITFDDGLRNNYDFAFPILKKYNMKATIFLIGDKIGKDPEFMTEEMIREMADSGLITFGVHTWGTHRLHADAAGKTVSPFAHPLPDETDGAYVARIYTDITTCSDLITELTGTAPCALAYPNGLSGPLTEAAVREAGLSLAFDGYSFRAIHLDEENPYHLERYSISGAYDVMDVVGLINRDKKV